MNTINLVFAIGYLISSVLFFGASLEYIDWMQDPTYYKTAMDSFLISVLFLLIWRKND